MSADYHDLSYLRETPNAGDPESVARHVMFLRARFVGVGACERAQIGYCPPMPGFHYDDETSHYLPFNFLEGADAKCRPS